MHGGLNLHPPPIILSDVKLLGKMNGNNDYCVPENLWKAKLIGQHLDTIVS
jgi:hypothetical protein